MNNFFAVDSILKCYGCINIFDIFLLPNLGLSAGVSVALRIATFQVELGDAPIAG
jgi:hypothetical protein